MSERKSNGMVASAGRRMLALAVLPVFVLGLASSSRAQAQSMAAGSGPASSSTSGRVAPAIAATQAAKPNSAVNSTAQKGPSEGIKVHGHWTIEVHNPDGKLVKHVEFENSLDPGFSLTMGNYGTVAIPGGAALLNAMFSLQAQPDPASWGIFLLGSTSMATLQTGSNGPCGPTLQVSAGLSGIGATSQPAVINGCVLFPPYPNGTNYGTSFSGQSTLVGSNQCPEQGVSCNVASTPIGTSPLYTGLQITGSVAATQSGQISTVATVNYAPCGAHILTSPESPCIGSFSEASQYFQLVGNSPLYLYMASFTSSSNFPGAPISVIAGQIVTATVSISFQ